MTIHYLLLVFILAGQPVLAQVDSAKNTNIERRVFPDYEQEIMYYGKHNQYFTVHTFLKNDSLLRLDSYSIIPQTLPNGYQLDSVSRIIRHGPTKIMYLTSSRVYISCEYKDNFLNGPFMVFYEDGAIKRKEYYRNGRLTQSKCYTPEGNQQHCEPFYQPAQFQGKPTDLSGYLKQKLESVLDGTRVRTINAKLILNEIGQVVAVSASVRSSELSDQQTTAIASYVQQVLRNMPEWSTDKLNWKPAINDGIPTSSTCILSVFRYYGAIQYNLSFQL